jgi:hypothetical protein
MMKAHRFLLLASLFCGGCLREPNLVSDSSRDTMTEPGTSSTTDAVPAGTTAECKRASDCELVAEDCCGCSSGGKHRAIAKSQRAAYDKRQQARCGATFACLAVLSGDPSCLMDAGCRGGRCVLVPRQ